MVRAKATRDFISTVLRVPPTSITVGNVHLSSEKTDKCFTHGFLSTKAFDVRSVLGTVSEYVTSVTHLSLYNINLASHVLEFFQLFPNLVNVSLINCQLGTLVGLSGCCKSLILLVVTNNDIAEIPDDFEELKETLTYLDLSQNPVRQIPDFLTGFQRLRHLDVSNTLIREFPQDIGKMRALRTLEAKYTPIGALPQSFCKLRVSHWK